MATAAEALRKLTGGQTLTNEERVLLNLTPVTTSPEALGNFYQGMGSSRFTPVNLPPEEEVIDMPSDEDMAAAEDAYTQARKDLNLPADTGKGTPQDNSKRQSAYDDLLAQFKQYGLESLVEPLKGLIADPSISEGEFTLRLRNTEPYKKRFAANAARVSKGLRALDEADYIALEDQYQNVMRNYGLPASYYSKGELGRQEGLEKLIGADVSSNELEERIITAQDRVMKSNPEVLKSLKDFYGDTINNGDILAYALDPEKALKDIQRKVTAAEIQGAANIFGLNQVNKESTPEQIKALEARANALAGYGVTKAQATEGFSTIADIAPRGSQLADIYKEDPYNQSTAEAEVFNTAGAADAKRKRKKLTALETAAFSGSSGVGALGRDRANGQSGAGSF